MSSRLAYQHEWLWPGRPRLQTSVPRHQTSSGQSRGAMPAPGSSVSDGGSVTETNIPHYLPPTPPEPGVQIPHAARPSRRVTAQPYAPLTVRDRGRRLSSAQPAHATRPIISTGAMSARWPPNAHPYHHTSRVSIGLGAFSILHRRHGANQSGIPSSLPYPVSPYLANNIVE